MDIEVISDMAEDTNALQSADLLRVLQNSP